jgi:hypothetical protein
VNTQTFIVELTNNASDVSAELWDSDEPFGCPIASAVGDTADQAVTNLFSQITITFPEETTDA